MAASLLRCVRCWFSRFGSVGLEPSRVFEESVLKRAAHSCQRCRLSFISSQNPPKGLQNSSRGRLLYLALSSSLICSSMILCSRFSGTSTLNGATYIHFLLILIMSWNLSANAFFHNFTLCIVSSKCIYPYNLTTSASPQTRCIYNEVSVRVYPLIFTCVQIDGQTSVLAGDTASMSRVGKTVGISFQSVSCLF